MRLGKDVLSRKRGETPRFLEQEAEAPLVISILLKVRIFIPRHRRSGIDKVGVLRALLIPAKDYLSGSRINPKTAPLPSREGGGL